MINSYNYNRLRNYRIDFNKELLSTLRFFLIDVDDRCIVLSWITFLHDASIIYRYLERNRSLFKKKKKVNLTTFCNMIRCKIKITLCLVHGRSYALFPFK